MYHRVAELDLDPGGLAVSPKRFAEHAEVLRRCFRPLSLRALVAGMRDRAVLRDSVAITFDDGYVDNLHEAKPFLELHDIPATVFVISGYIGSRRTFWWDELERICCGAAALPDRLELKVGGSVRTWTIAPGVERRNFYRSLRDVCGTLKEPERDELFDKLRTWSGVAAAHAVETLSADELRRLADGGLMEIGAHTITHRRLPALPRAEQLEEIRGSKRQLEQVLGLDVRLFSYPFGAHDRTTVRCTREAGLACACTTRAGGIHRSTDPYRLPRLYVGDWSADELVERVSEWLGR